MNLIPVRQNDILWLVVSGIKIVYYFGWTYFCENLVMSLRLAASLGVGGWLLESDGCIVRDI